MGQLCTLNKKYKIWQEIYLSVCNYENEWKPVSALLYQLGHS